MAQAHTLRGTTEARRRSKPRKVKPNDPANPKCIAAEDKRERRRVRNMKHEFKTAWGRVYSRSLR